LQPERGPVWVIRVGSGLSAFAGIADMNSSGKVAMGEIETNESKQMFFLNQDCAYPLDLESMLLAHSDKIPFSTIGQTRTSADV